MDLPERANDPPELADLVRRASRADRDAFARLYDLLAPRVYGLILKIIGPAARADADDILQDVMFELWRNAAKYNPQSGSVSTWVLLIARSRTLDHIRRRRAYQQATTGAAAASLLATPNQHPPSTISDTPLDRSLADLPDDQRVALTLAFARGMTREQIAASLDIPVGTVKTRVRAAIQRLAGVSQSAKAEGGLA